MPLTDEQKHAVVSYPEMVQALKNLAEIKSDWAGIPMPIGELPLRVEKRYPFKELESIGQSKDTEHPDAKHYSIANSWYSKALGGTIVIIRDNRTGKAMKVLEPWNCGQFTINTLMASDAWTIEAEHNALNKLGTLLPHHMFRRYLLTGSFLESSKRSGCFYIFRKLRPTIVFKEKNASMSMLCTLCLHPIAYYEGTWAGSMCPTDDVIAHLMLMRGDEHLFWKMANQHPVTHPQSGI